MFTIKIAFYFEEEIIPESVLQKVFSKALSKIQKKDDFKIEIKTYFDPNNNLLESNNNNLKWDNHVTFFEVSRGHPCIMFNCGYLTAKNATLNFLNFGSEIKKELPHYIIDGRELIFYNESNPYFKGEKFQTLAMTLLNKVISNYFDFRNHIHKIWFDRSDNIQIFVVGGPDYDENALPGNKLHAKHNSVVANPKTSLNSDIYSYGDKDTFIDSCIFLAKYLANPKLVRASSNERGMINDAENMVVIGGPGSEGDENNFYCKMFMDKMKTQIRYGLNQEDQYYLENINDQNKFLTVITKGEITKDYGYFACFNNPLNPNKRIILINGIHTMGVLGAFLAFSDDEGAEKNYKTVLHKAATDKNQSNKLKIGQMLEFECFFEVDVYNKRPKIPTIKAENIFFFNKKTVNLRIQKPSKKLVQSKKVDIISLRKTIQGKINSASQVYSHPHRKDLLALLERFNFDEQFNYEQLLQVNSVIEENGTIPTRNILKIKNIIKND